MRMETKQALIECHCTQDCYYTAGSRSLSLKTTRSENTQQ